MDQIINVEKERKILDSRPYRFYSMYYNVTRVGRRQLCGRMLQLAKFQSTNFE